MSDSLFIKKAKQFGFIIKKLEEPHLFLLENFYFNNSTTSVELRIEEDYFNVKHLKGYWHKISSAEELITFNYFEYYLTELNQNEQINLPIVWEELYKSVGLIVEKNKQYREARVSSILKKIEDHFGYESGIKNNYFWQEVAKEFPECIYYGQAYRSILVSKDTYDQSKVFLPGYSWALTMNGIKEFIINGDKYPINKDPGFQLVVGTIKGISLIHLKQLFESDFKKHIKESSLFNEEEIILLELISLNDFSFIFAKDLK